MTPVASDNAPAGEQLLRGAPATSSTPTGANQPAGQGDTLATPSLSPTLSGPVALAAQQAAQLWRNAQKAAKQPCRMQPADEMTYCENPLVRSYTVNAFTATKIAASNPMRVGIILNPYNNSTGQMILGFGAAPLAATQVGLPIMNSAQPLSFTQKDFLNLVQVDIYALMLSGTGTIGVVEIVLRQWPQGG